MMGLCDAWVVWFRVGLRWCLVWFVWCCVWYSDRRAMMGRRRRFGVVGPSRRAVTGGLPPVREESHFFRGTGRVCTPRG